MICRQCKSKQFLHQNSKNPNDNTGCMPSLFKGIQVFVLSWLIIIIYFFVIAGASKTTDIDPSLNKNTTNAEHNQSNANAEIHKDKIEIEQRNKIDLQKKDNEKNARYFLNEVHAKAVCTMFESYKTLTDDCKISSWDQSVGISIDTTSDLAKKICKETGNLFKRNDLFFEGDWKLIIKSPYSNESPIAKCKLPNYPTAL